MTHLPSARRVARFLGPKDAPDARRVEADPAARRVRIALILGLIVAMTFPALVDRSVSQKIDHVAVLTD